MVYDRRQMNIEVMMAVGDPVEEKARPHFRVDSNEREGSVLHELGE